MNQKLKRYTPIHSEREMLEHYEGEFITFDDYQKLLEQLDRAEKVIMFYSDIHNFSYDGHENSDTAIARDGEFIENKNGEKSHVGGKRARQYFKEKEQV